VYYQQQLQTVKQKGINKAINSVKQCESSTNRNLTSTGTIGSKQFISTMMYSAAISPVNSNMTITPQNHIQYNTHWPNINSSTISFSPTILPPQIQETQMQLSSNFYLAPARQELQIPGKNYTNNKDRGQHIQN
jgi:hypothetical protein